MLFLTRHVGETFAKFAAPLIVGAGTVGTGVYIWLTDGFQTKQKALNLSSQKLSDITRENEKLKNTISQRKHTKIQSKERSEQLSRTLQLLKMRAILSYMSNQYSGSVDKFKEEKEKLEKKINENEDLKKEILVLEEAIKNNLTELKNELEKIKTGMPNFYTGVLKTGEYRNFASININKSTLGEQENNQTSFKGIGQNGTLVDFKIKKNSSLFKVEEAINEMKKSGISLTVNESALNPWNGIFYLTNSRKCWDCKVKVTPDGGKKISELKKVTTNQQLNLKDIFETTNKDMYHNAVKLLEVMSRIQAIKFDQVGSESNIFEIADGSAKDLLTKNTPITKEAWKDNKQNWNIEVHSFGSKDDFVKYWIMKTIELTISKKVDLSELLDPIYQKSSYSSAN